MLGSSVSKKVIMGLTGLFLISFLVVHLGINLCALLDDGGETFNIAAEFMAKNLVIRTMEIGLFLGFIIHIVDGLYLEFKNRQARPVAYYKSPGSENSTWYSRSMGLLGTLLLIFLIVHLAHFWVKSRFGDITDEYGRENLYLIMAQVFKNPIVVVLYVISQISLAYHLLHGFQSAFQTLGFNHPKYSPLIKVTGTAYAILVPLLFAIIPVVLYFRHA